MTANMILLRQLILPMLALVVAAFVFRSGFSEKRGPTTGELANPSKDTEFSR